MYSFRPRISPAVGAIAALLLMPLPPTWAAPPPARISVPALGWVLSPDGTQIMEIAGLPSSPRPGRSLALPSPARAAWSAPDGLSALLRLDDAFYLALPDQPEPLLLLSVPVPEQPAHPSAAWDRGSQGFAICYGEQCLEFDRAGALRGTMAAAEGAQLLAYSRQSGLVTRNGDALAWLRDSASLTLDIPAAAAAFRPGHQELWVLDHAGQLYSFDAAGSRSEMGEFLPAAAGLVASADGSSFFAAAYSGAAARFAVDTRSVTAHQLEDSVDGVWPAPGEFAVRLHDSPKRPIAIWNGDSGTAAASPALIVSAPEVQ
jgi:hypothetical protein